ncbi:MAG: hypothetical protein ACREMQ_14250 [Longimicrobiales bacterium]
MFRGLVALVCILTVASAASRQRSADAPSSAQPLPFFYDLYTFRGPRNSTAVVAAFAVHAGDLAKAEVDNEVRYRFGVSLVLADTALRTVSQTDDSVFVRFARPLSDEHLLFTQIEVHTPPSATTLQRVIMIDATEPGIGQLYSTPFTIPDYSGSELMLSDIALGHPDANAGWTRGDVTIALLPTSQFPQSRFDVYYEVYNLPAGRPYATDILVEHVNESGAPVAESRPVRLRFSGEAASRRDGTLAELRRIEAALGKGRYRITITVTDQQNGRTASRSRPFHVRGWGPGATMVVAAPRGGRHSRVRDR